MGYRSKWIEGKEEDEAITMMRHVENWVIRKRNEGKGMLNRNRRAKTEFQTKKLLVKNGERERAGNRSEIRWGEGNSEFHELEHRLTSSSILRTALVELLVVASFHSRIPEKKMFKLENSKILH